MLPWDKGTKVPWYHGAMIPRSRRERYARGAAEGYAASAQAAPAPFERRRAEIYVRCAVLRFIRGTDFRVCAAH